jgi:hypothetical protein
MIVTTWSPQGYEQYGRRFIETYDSPYPLVVYVEDDKDIEGVETRSLYDIPGCTEFLKAVEHYKPNHYRRDVNKFSRKVFAITDAARHFSGKMAFIGGDTVFYKPFEPDFLDNILDGYYLAYLGRDGYHSETDFLAFNTEHKINDLFMKLFLMEYTTGAFQHLKYFCDSDVFDHLRLLLNAPANDLNISRDMRHPFVNSILGDYCDHLKGPQRKEDGQSHRDDYINKRRVQVRAV